MRKEMCKLFSLISITMILIFSCRDDDSMHENIGISFAAEVVENGEAKSSAPADENMISDVNLFICDAAGKIIHSSYLDKSSGRIDISVTTGAEYKVFAIANVGDLSISGEVKDTLELKRLTYEFREFNTLADGDGTIPMSGILPYRRLSDGDVVMVPLTRLISRFRVIVDTTGLNPDVELFEIQNIRIRQLNYPVEYFSESKAENESEICDIGDRKGEDDLRTLYTSGVDFYLPENAQGDLLSGNDDEKEHIPPSPYDLLCTYVDMIVRYRSKTQYNDALLYRFYLHDGKSLDNFDIKRNTMYLCTVCFTGSGINEATWRVVLSGMKDLVTDIEITPEKFTFGSIGESFMFNATVLPSTAANSKISWSTSDPSVATVDQEGTVTSVGDGTCRIIASSSDGTLVSDYAEVTVDSYIYPESVTITPSDSRIYIGDKLRLSATVFPANSNNPAVEWESSDPLVATVSGTGEVVGRTIGRAVITATCVDNGVTGEAAVHVMDKAYSGVEVPPVLYPDYNSPYTLAWEAEPYGTPTFVLTTLSGNTSGATLVGNVIEADNPSGIQGTIGKYRISSSLNGIDHRADFEVSGGYLDITSSSSVGYVGESRSITISKRLPADVPITWKSSNPMVARVNTNGRVTFNGVGKVTITAISSTGARDEISFDVQLPTLSLPQSVSVYEGERKQIPYIGKPSSGLTLKWEIISGDEYLSLAVNGWIRGEKRSGRIGAVLRASYVEVPSVYDETLVTVDPAVYASITGSKVLLNVEGFENAATVSGYPGFLSISSSHAPGTSIRWEITDPYGDLTSDILISDGGRVTAHNDASGIYTIVGWDDTKTYRTSAIEIQVYRYLEYQIGLDTYRYTVNGASDDEPDGSITYIYSMSSRWSANAEQTVYRAGNPLQSLKVLHYPQSGPRWTIAGGDNTAQVFASNIVLTDSYNYQFTVWDYLFPSSYLWNTVSGESLHGTKGMAYMLGSDKKTHFYYLRQDGSGFFNDPNL